MIDPNLIKPSSLIANACKAYSPTLLSKASPNFPEALLRFVESGVLPSARRVEKSTRLEHGSSETCDDYFHAPLRRKSRED